MYLSLYIKQLKHFFDRDLLFPFKNGNIISVELNKGSACGSYYVCIWYGVFGLGVIYARPLQATIGLKIP